MKVNELVSASTIREALQAVHLAWQSLACVVAVDTLMASVALHDVAAELGVPLRFVGADEQPPVAWREASGSLAIGDSSVMGDLATALFYESSSWMGQAPPDLLPTALNWAC